MAGEKRVMSEVYIFSGPLLSSYQGGNGVGKLLLVQSNRIIFNPSSSNILYSTQSVASPKYETFSVRHSKKTAVY